jgi:hypothetical protein
VAEPSGTWQELLRRLEYISFFREFLLGIA